MTNNRAVKLNITIGQRTHKLHIADHNGQGVTVGIEGSTLTIDPRELNVSSSKAKATEREQDLSDEGTDNTVTSPISGVVSSILVKPGEDVAAGQPLIIIMAMKMENEICAVRNARIRNVAVTAGQAVQQDGLLMELE